MILAEMGAPHEVYLGLNDHRWRWGSCWVSSHPKDTRGEVVFAATLLAPEACLDILTAGIV